MLSAIFEQIVNGIVSGSVYAIVAVGMTMIFGVLRAINFAHGEYYMLGTFGAWFAIEYFDLPYPVAITIGVIAPAVIAVVVGKFVMQRIVGAPPETGVLATLGIALVLQNTVILVFGGGYKFFSGGYIEPLKDDRTLVITASRSDRISFGCGDRSDATFFGEAFFQRGLATADSFEAAFDIARKRVDEREKGSDYSPPSSPQLWVGGAMTEKLKTLRAHAQRGTTTGLKSRKSPERGFPRRT